MEMEETYRKSHIVKDGEIDKVDFVVCSEDEDIGTASSEEDYSYTDSYFKLH